MRRSGALTGRERLGRGDLGRSRGGGGGSGRGLGALRTTLVGAEARAGTAATRLTLLVGVGLLRAARLPPGDAVRQPPHDDLDRPHGVVVARGRQVDEV